MSLYRQFEVAGSSGTQLDSNLRFRVHFFGRLIATPAATASYEIACLLRDLTDNAVEYVPDNCLVDSDQESGTLIFKVMGGFPLPLPIPGVSKQVGDKQLVYRILLTEGHRYEIELRLTVRAESTVLSGNYRGAWASFNTAELVERAVTEWFDDTPDTSFTEKGLVRWADLELEVGR